MRYAPLLPLLLSGCGILDRVLPSHSESVEGEPITQEGNDQKTESNVPYSLSVETISSDKKEELERVENVLIQYGKCVKADVPVLRCQNLWELPSSYGYADAPITTINREVAIGLEDGGILTHKRTERIPLTLNGEPHYLSYHVFSQTDENGRQPGLLKCWGSEIGICGVMEYTGPDDLSSREAFFAIQEAIHAPQE